MAYSRMHNTPAVHRIMTTDSLVVANWSEVPPDVMKGNIVMIGSSFYGYTGNAWVPLGGEDDYAISYREETNLSEDFINIERYCLAEFYGENVTTPQDLDIRWSVGYSTTPMPHELQHRDANDEIVVPGTIDGFPVVISNVDIPSQNIKEWSTNLLTDNNGVVTANTDTADFKIFRSGESQSAQIESMFGSVTAILTPTFASGQIIHPGTWQDTNGISPVAVAIFQAFGAYKDSGANETVYYEMQAGYATIPDDIQIAGRVNSKNLWDYYQGQNPNAWSPATNSERWQLPLPSTVVATRETGGLVTLGDNGPALIITRPSGSQFEHNGNIVDDVYAPDPVVGNRKIAYFKLSVKYGIGDRNQYPGELVHFWWAWNYGSVLALSFIRANHSALTDAVLNETTFYDTIDSDLLEGLNTTISDAGYSATVTATVTQTGWNNIWFNPQNIGLDKPGRAAWQIYQVDVSPFNPDLEDTMTPKIIIIGKDGTTGAPGFFNISSRNYGLPFGSGGNDGDPNKLIGMFGWIDTGKFVEQDWGSSIPAAAPETIDIKIFCTAPRLGFRDVASGYTAGVFALEDKFTNEITSITNWARNMFATFYADLFDLRIHQVLMQQQIFKLQNTTEEILINVKELNSIVIKLAEAINDLAEAVADADGGPFGLNSIFVGDLGVDMSLGILVGAAAIGIAFVGGQGMLAAGAPAGIAAIGGMSIGLEALQHMNVVFGSVIHSSDRLGRGESSAWTSFMISLMSLGLIVGGVSTLPRTKSANPDANPYDAPDAGEGDIKPVKGGIKIDVEKMPEVKSSGWRLFQSKRRKVQFKDAIEDGVAAITMIDGVFVPLVPGTIRPSKIISNTATGPDYKNPAIEREMMGF